MRNIKPGVEEIKQVLSYVSLLYQPGYWPEKKDWLPKNLSVIFFDQWNKKSWFLAVAESPPVPLKTAIKRPRNKAIEQVVERVVEVVEGLGIIFPANDIQRVYWNIKELKTAYEEYLEDMTEQQQAQLEQQVGSWSDMILQFTKWVCKRSGKKGFSIRQFDRDGSMWQKFVHTIGG